MGRENWLLEFEITFLFASLFKKNKVYTTTQKFPCVNQAMGGIHFRILERIHLYQIPWPNDKRFDLSSYSNNTIIKSTKFYFLFQ